MSEISKEEVKKVAQLARLELTEAETEKYQKELSAILGYVDILNKIDTGDVEATANVAGLTDICSKDAKNPSLNREVVLSNVPEKQNGYIKVKPVLE